MVDLVHTFGVETHVIFSGRNGSLTCETPVISCMSNLFCHNDVDAIDFIVVVAVVVRVVVVPFIEAVLFVVNTRGTRYVLPLSLRISEYVHRRLGAV